MVMVAIFSWFLISFSFRYYHDLGWCTLCFVAEMLVFLNIYIYIYIYMNRSTSRYIFFVISLQHIFQCISLFSRGLYLMVALSLIYIMTIFFIRGRRFSFFLFFSFYEGVFCVCERSRACSCQCMCIYTFVFLFSFKSFPSPQIIYDSWYYKTFICFVFLLESLYKCVCVCL